MLGLGAGTLAAYGRPATRLRIYEINEQVLDLARSEFSYLADSPATHRAGARRRPPDAGSASRPRTFDLLAVDAFSGDSIPTHLLTLEAMQGYLRHLNAPDGILAVHITNRYLDLRPVVAAAAEHFGKDRRCSMRWRATTENDFCFSLGLGAGDASGTGGGAAAGDERRRAARGASRASGRGADGFSNLFSVIK
jgi:hypothetical protein